MDFENNPINTSIWKYINEEKKRLSSGTPFINFDVPLSGTLYPHTVNDKELMSKILKVDKEKRVEFLDELILHLSVDERVHLWKSVTKTLDSKELTFFDKASIYNLIKPN